MSFRNGTSASYAFTARGDLTDHDWSRPGPALIAGYDFTYNNAGQVLSETLGGPDAALFKYAPPLSTDAYAPNGLNQYASVKGVALLYDGNGNLDRDVTNRRFTHDAENVLRRFGPRALRANTTRGGGRP